MSLALKSLKQHLIDPEICIRCNTCEETCPSKAITHDGRNYVVDPGKCGSCMACVSPCPTGAIDNWRTVLEDQAYGVAEQLTWDSLPADHPAEPPPAVVNVLPAMPPRTASRPVVNVYTSRDPAVATVVGNYRVTDSKSDSDTRHIVLDFGSVTFPVLEGQSIGVLPPGVDELGRPHHARQYSVASPRDGERPGHNNLALTVKRVSAGHAGRPARGICSNYLCDLERGDQVRVVGPFGSTFLMPNHSPSHLLMICTGTGSAPMRAMTEWRRRHRTEEVGRLMLFFGARTREELPYFGPLMSLPQDFIDINLAFSRTPGRPKRYVQDLMRERGRDVAELLRDEDAYIYVCGLRGMETGVLDALRDIACGDGIPWDALSEQLQAEGRLHFETY
jgi:benzoyl-CoA oxygenase/reductase BoxA protein